MKNDKAMMKKKILIPVFAVVIFLAGSGFVKSDFFEIAKQIEIFTTLFKELNMNYVDETNPAELMDTAIKNMLDDLDPYTKFLNEQDVEAYIRGELNTRQQQRICIKHRHHSVAGLRPGLYRPSCAGPRSIVSARHRPVS